MQFSEKLIIEWYNYKMLLSSSHFTESTVEFNIGMLGASLHRNVSRGAQHLFFFGGGGGNQRFYCVSIWVMFITCAVVLLCTSVGDILSQWARGATAYIERARNRYISTPPFCRFSLFHQRCRNTKENRMVTRSRWNSNQDGKQEKFVTIILEQTRCYSI